MNIQGTLYKDVCASRWLKKISFAVLDQGLISGTNFTLGILLARWLSPSEYGIYALCFSAYLLISAIQQAIVLEPMSVLGPTQYQERYRAYVGTLVVMQPVLGILFAL